jgi:aspartate/methionine/tyrosine aminotransferase
MNEPPGRPQVRDTLRNLTEWELYALDGAYNIADGHARGWITRAHHDLANRINQLYSLSIYASQSHVEEEFAKAYFELCGQKEALIEGEPPILHYSSSIAIDLAGRVLTVVGAHRVALVTPTFDNIPALLRSRGLELVPIDEQALVTPASAYERLEGADALFLVVPNNPTGTELSSQDLHELASFRFFGRMSGWDLYAVLRSHAGLDWIVIEDTGKAWGIAELKIGMMVSSLSLTKLVQKVSNDLRLNVSPFTLRALTTLMAPSTQERQSHISDLVHVAEINRRVLRSQMNALGLKPISPASLSSVEWLKFEDPALDSTHVCEGVRQQGVVILPGGPFYWDAPRRGRSYVRIALLRDPRYFARAVGVLRRALQYSVDEPRSG